MFAGPQVTYKLKQKKKKAMRNEMKFGVNVAAPFVGMKRDQRHMESEYPFAKQYCIRRSDRSSRVLVVQEMPEESFKASEHRIPKMKIEHVLEGPEGMEATLAANTGLVARLKATIDGQAYQFGDFLIRVGSCKKGAVYRGVGLEVEYRPCSKIVDGVAMIEALLPQIEGAEAFVRCSDLLDSAVFGTDPEFSVQHTALQTIDLFNTVFR
ncbi:unnamed protein product [Ascophyllum nodosum]